MAYLNKIFMVLGKELNRSDLKANNEMELS